MIEARDTDAKGGADFWPEYKPGDRDPGSRSKLLYAGAAAVALVAIIAVAVVVLTGGGGDDKGKAPAAAADNGTKASPTAYTPQLAEKSMAKLAARTADARPVTAGEVFTADAKSVKYRKFTFALAGSQLSTDCKAVTWGTRLQGDLATAGCTQILRGAYVSSDKSHVGQWMAINLSGQDGANQIVRDLDPNTQAGFVLPLKAEGMPAFGTGFSAAYAQAYGHYVVVTWVQRAGGATPSSLNEMIDASLAIDKPTDFVWGRLEMADGNQ
ncbi:hypothetical protein J4573_21895 [Actinomadura barringtoniae]|uniref:Uncharacterized protein n=1 Tax=Actinomadura barringtoniae TaxID=1427535 RepID=A0A939T5P1_9ACTN|nr:hypothetical protein [Actinomadura barringtoniae]MBO2449769.1 hypothetical protein [Actinomadura barringtoniae]